MRTPYRESPSQFVVKAHFLAKRGAEVLTVEGPARLHDYEPARELYAAGQKKCVISLYLGVRRQPID